MKVFLIIALAAILLIGGCGFTAEVNFPMSPQAGTCVAAEAKPGPFWESAQTALGCRDKATDPIVYPNSIMSPSSISAGELGSWVVDHAAMASGAM